MSENCSHECSSCGKECSERKADPFSCDANEFSKIKKVIGVVSGKGGVGKSLVTSMLAVIGNRKGYKTAILDADVTGPSIPKAFGIYERATGNEQGIFPVCSKNNIPVMSVNLLTENETDPVIWRGPVIANTVKQFWSDVIWGEVDYMFIDMPPGTGDVPLTVFQSIPVDGIIIVASPQELVGMIVEKAVNMAAMMNVPVLGLVENMSYAICPECGKKIHIFGESHIKEIADKHGVTNIAQIPLDSKIALACDQGKIEEFNGNWLDLLFENVVEVKENKNMKIVVAGMGNMVSEHFGHCENFILFDVENGMIVKEESIESPGHRPGFLPNFLADQGAEVVIAGGMGGGAVDIFNERGVEVIVGASGDARMAVEKYLKGELISTGSICHKHEHADECGEHK